MKRLRLALLVAMSLAATVANAGPFTDEMSKCVVQKTTTADRTALVRWMFIAAARHPDISSIAKVSDQERAEASEAMGRLMMRLLTQSCMQETKKAVQFEGPQATEAAFTVLGQVAGKELFGNPTVAAALSDVEKYLDSQALKALGTSK